MTLVKNAKYLLCSVLVLIVLCTCSVFALAAEKAEQYDEWLFIGDARIVDTQKNTGIDAIGAKDADLEFLKKATDDITKVEGKNIVFNIGYFDGKSKANEYVQYFNSLPSDFLANNNVIFMSVNPVGTSKTNPTVENFDVMEYNDTIKKGLPPSMTYLDTYSWLMDKGFKAKDGRIYHKKTEAALIDYVTGGKYNKVAPSTYIANNTVEWKESATGGYYYATGIKLYDNDPEENFRTIADQMGWTVDPSRVLEWKTGKDDGEEDAEIKHDYSTMVKWESEMDGVINERIHGGELEYYEEFTENFLDDLLRSEEDGGWNIDGIFDFMQSGGLGYARRVTGAERMIKTARGQLGTGGEEYQQYAGGSGEWSASFLNWCGMKCGFTDLFPQTSSIAQLSSNLMAQGCDKKQLRLRGITPTTLEEFIGGQFSIVPGDLIFFNFKHVALVSSVGKDYICLIDGDHDGTVAEYMYTGDDLIALQKHTNSYQLTVVRVQYPGKTDWRAVHYFFKHYPINGQILENSAIAGLCGNIEYESAWDPSVVALDTNQKNAGGLICWNGERLVEMQDWIAAQGGEWFQVDQQLQFLVYEMTEGKWNGIYDHSAGRQREEDGYQLGVPKDTHILEDFLSAENTAQAAYDLGVAFAAKYERCSNSGQFEGNYHRRGMAAMDMFWPQMEELEKTAADVHGVTVSKGGD